MGKQGIKCVTYSPKAGDKLACLVLLTMPLLLPVTMWSPLRLYEAIMFCRSRAYITPASYNSAKSTTIELA